MFAEIDELTHLGVVWLGEANATNAVGPRSVLKTFSIVPQEFAQGVGIASIRFFMGRIIALNDDDLFAATFLEFGVLSVVKAADFKNRHETATFPGSLDELTEKIANRVMIGTDLTGLNDTSVFIAKIDGALRLVKVDTKIKHGGLRELKLGGCKTNFILRETSVRFLTRYLSEYQKPRHAEVLKSAQKLDASKDSSLICEVVSQAVFF